MLDRNLRRKRSPCQVNAVRPEAMQPSCVPDKDRQGNRLDHKQGRKAHVSRLWTCEAVVTGIHSVLTPNSSETERGGCGDTDYSARTFPGRSSHMSCWPSAVTVSPNRSMPGRPCDSQ